MATPKKNMFSKTIYVAGGILTIGAAVTYGLTLIDKRIDERLDRKMKYAVLLMQQIATPEQKRAADEEFERWNKQ